MQTADRAVCIQVCFGSGVCSSRLASYTAMLRCIAIAVVAGGLAGRALAIAAAVTACIAIARACVRRCGVAGLGCRQRCKATDGFALDLRFQYTLDITQLLALLGADHRDGMA